MRGEARYVPTEVVALGAGTDRHIRPHPTPLCSNESTTESKRRNIDRRNSNVTMQSTWDEKTTRFDGNRWRQPKVEMSTNRETIVQADAAQDRRLVIDRRNL